MKKILMTVVMLVMMLPTFGQKLNSRGEKMVSSVYVYGEKGRLESSYEFDYNKDCSLYSLTCIKGRRKTVIKQNGKTLEKIVWLDGKKETDESTEYTLNENGFVRTEKMINYNVDKSVLDYTYNLKEYSYCYINQLNRYTLTKHSRSQWKAFKNKQPVLCGDEYDNDCFEYDNGNPQSIFRVSVGGKEPRGNYPSLIYNGNHIDDTNINLCMLNPSFGLANVTICITEWVPLNCRTLPTQTLSQDGKKICREFYYDYYDGNIVCMRFNWVFNGKNFMTIKINYVEE